VIRWDKPGCGLPDREGTGLSFGGQVAAVLAMADAAGAGRFRVFAASLGGQVAAAIAARYPERVELSGSVVHPMRAAGCGPVCQEVTEVRRQFTRWPARATPS
jgi:pimeloyl-ACP methyl ester carboxylesterase